MIIIVNEDAVRFSRDGKLYDKSFRARAVSNNKVTLQDIRTGRDAWESSHFSEFQIDGLTYGTQIETINALMEVIYSGVGGAVTISGDDGNPINNGNPLPIVGVDNNKRVSRNTVFGDKITAKRIPQLAAQFQYPLAAEDTKPPELGSGGTIIQENSLLKVKTDAQLGSFAKLQSTDTLRYVPGFECYLYATPDFDTPIAGQKQLVGIMDTETGFGFGYNGTDFVFLYRRDGTDQYFNIDLAAFQSKYGYSFNPQKGNIYLLTYGYLGYAPVKLEVIPPDGGLANLFTFEYPNNFDQTHLSQTFLPLRAEMDNLTGSTAMTLSIGSLNAGIVNGGDASEYTFTRPFNLYRQDVALAGNTEIIGFRNKTTFGGITNYVRARLFNFNVSQNQNREGILVIFKNPVILNTPTWNDVDVDSILEYSDDVLIDFAASNTSYFSITIPRVGSVDKYVEPLKFDLKPDDIAVFGMITAGSGELSFSNYWRELF